MPLTSAAAAGHATTIMSDPEPQVSLPWLLRLRWLGVLGQAFAVVVATEVFQLGYSIVWLGSLVLLSALSNVALAVVARRLSAQRSGTVMGSVLALDTLLLTALLAASGGPMNPFTVFYLVHITLSAVVLSTRWTLLVSTLAFGGFGALFLLPHGAHAMHHDASGMAPHLQGMWVAFGLAALLTTFFVRQVTDAIRAQREQIASLREAGARNARLASITTLAAGAAHELGSPLGTIAIAAHDAELALRAIPGAGHVVEDLRLITLEVERCQEILGLMSARAGEASEDARRVGVPELVRSVRAHLGEERSAKVRFDVSDRDSALDLPAGQIAESLVALIRNGLDASDPGSGIVVQVGRSGADAIISVEDRGSGIDAAILPRVGEPFFTTKQPGRGLGLGVFLVRAFVESRGGDLDIDSAPGEGTRARMRIPLGRAHSEVAA
jgi:two-component system, sensor histidine kinase RegB